MRKSTIVRLLAVAACAVSPLVAGAADGKELLQAAEDARKRGAYAEGIKLADRAFDKGASKFDALRTEFLCRHKLYGEDAWDWMERRIKKAENANRHFAADLMGLYGFLAYKFFRDDRARHALAWFEKRKMKPRWYPGHWVTTVRTFDAFKTFPRAEEDIVFPAAPAWFGTAKGKTVRLKDAAAFNPSDMTAAIQKVIDDPETGTIVFDKMTAPWRISSLKPRSNLVFVFEDGVRVLADKTTQEKNPQDCDMFDLVGVSNVVFVGRGETPAGVRIGKYEDYDTRRKLCRTYGGSGFDLDGAKNIAIYNLTVADCSMDGLCVGGLRPSNNGIYVKDVVLASNNRQACSLVNVHGIYFKNVAFTDTRGAQPMCGIDVEPSIQEVQAVSEIYLLDCTFKGNWGGQLHFSCSSAYPVTMLAKRCVFEPNIHTPTVSIFALPGIYFGADVAAPSRILFDECTFRQHPDKIAFAFLNSSFFNVTLRNSLIEETQPGRRDATTGAPVAFELQRTYAKNDCDKPGKVVFENLKVKGWKDRPTIAFRDTAGTYSVTNLHGTILHNSKKVKAEGFRHFSREKSLTHFAPFDPAAYAPLKKVAKPVGGSVPLRMKLLQGGPWYEPKPKYQAVYWDGEAWCTRDADSEMTNLADLADKPVAFVGKPVMSWGVVPVDFSPAYQIESAKDYKGETVYFEVPAGATECVIRLTGDAEVRNAAGRIVGAYAGAEDAAKGAKYIRFKPTSKKSEIYSVRVFKFAHVKFFHPLTGVIAEKPEWLPRLAETKAKTKGKTRRR